MANWSRISVQTLKKKRPPISAGVATAVARFLGIGLGTAIWFAILLWLM